MNRTRKLLATLVAIMMGVVGIVVGTSSPASASPCNLPGWTNPSTGHGSQFQQIPWNPKTVFNQTLTWHDREVCWRLGIEGTAAQYRFKVWVQDLRDVCDAGVDPTACSDIDGNAHIQWQTPGTSPWTTLVWDWDSANWAHNESNGQSVWNSPWLTQVTNGPANQFKFRLWGTSRSRTGISVWQWHNFYTLPLSITY